MHSDIEAEFDLIGFRIHADLIRRVVADPTWLPVVLGARPTIVLPSGR